MFKKMSLKGRLVLLMSCMLSICLLVLTVLNYRSAAMQIQNTALTAVKMYRLSMPLDEAQTLPEEDTAEPESEPALLPESITVEQEPIVPAVRTQVAVGQKLFCLESLISLLIMVLAGGVITYFAAGKSLRPVKQLAKQIKNMNEYNLTERMEVPETRDEIADLACSFNEMLEKLDGAFEAKRHFSANAAHELRTPLAVITTRLEVFKKRKDHTKEEYDALLETLAAHTARLSGLVNDLLFMTEIEAVEEREEIAAEELIREVFEDLKEVAEKYCVGLKEPIGHAMIMGNDTLLYRVFYNLAENAVKYNHPGGFAAAEIRREKGMAVITVSDSGQGIPAGMKDRIFEPFFRADKSRSRKMGGAGIGLSVVKNIVEKHGGRIEVHERSGGGSEFTVMLPDISETVTI